MTEAVTKGRQISKVADVFKPSRIRALPTDHRGYPIFYVALLDDTGKPFFTHNDQGKSMECLRRDLCGICGQKLLPRRWMVGGPLSIFDKRGTFVDGPVHGECGRYALQVCPYLAAPNYAGEIAKLMKPKFEETKVHVYVDETRLPGRPPLFCMALASKVIGELKRGGLFYYPKRPWLRIEYWVHGRQLNETEAQPYLAEGLNPDRLKAYDDKFKAH